MILTHIQLVLKDECWLRFRFLFVCLFRFSILYVFSGLAVICAKMTEPVQMHFRLWAQIGPGIHVLDGGFRSPMGRSNFWGKISYCKGGANVPTWEGTFGAIANMTAPSICGGDVILCQITLTTC